MKAGLHKILVQEMSVAASSRLVRLVIITHHENRLVLMCRQAAQAATQRSGEYRKKSDRGPVEEWHSASQRLACTKSNPYLKFGVGRKRRICGKVVIKTATTSAVRAL